MLCTLGLERTEINALSTQIIHGSHSGLETRKSTFNAQSTTWFTLKFENDYNRRTKHLTPLQFALWFGNE